MPSPRDPTLEGPAKMGCAKMGPEKRTLQNAIAIPLPSMLSSTAGSRGHKLWQAAFSILTAREGAIVEAGVVACGD